MRTLLSFLALALLTSLSLASSARAQEGDIVIVIAQPAPVTQDQTASAPMLSAPQAPEAPAQLGAPNVAIVDGEERTRPRVGLAVAGASVFVASYALNLSGSLLLATFPGMWDRSGSFAEYSLIPLAGPWLQMSVLRQGEEALGVLLGAAGVAQAIGAIVLIAGVTGRETVRSAPSYAVMPYADPQGGGVSLAGTF